MGARDYTVHRSRLQPESGPLRVLNTGRGALIDVIWRQCMGCLQDEIPPQQFETWIRPLHVDQPSANTVRLVAPNRFVQDWVADKFLDRIRELYRQFVGDPSVELEISAGIPIWDEKAPAPTTRPRGLGAQVPPGLSVGQGGAGPVAAE